jgi:hypothetical protein
MRSWDSSVGIAMGYGLGGRGSIPGKGKRFVFHFPTTSRLTLGPTQPPTQWAPGPLSPRVKRLGREADHSPPRSRMVELYLHSPIYLHGIVLNKLSTGTTVPLPLNLEPILRNTDIPQDLYYCNVS